jgi:carboxymethylenebutenolidase
MKGTDMNHSQPQGFLAVPPSGEGPGVLVLHAWWGLNDTIKATCTRLAAAGFTAFAADLYHGKIADTIPGAEVLGSTIDANYQQARDEVAQAALFLSERTGGSLAVVAFSLGGFFAVDLAAAHPELIRSVVLFYGTSGTMPIDHGRSKAAYLGHFAENDPYETQSNVDGLEASLKQAGRPVTFHRYPGTGHWFFEPDRTDAYDPAAASLAWDRTLAFLKRSSAS